MCSMWLEVSLIVDCHLLSLEEGAESIWTPGAKIAHIQSSFPYPSLEFASLFSFTDGLLLFHQLRFHVVYIV